MCKFLRQGSDILRHECKILHISVCFYVFPVCKTFGNVKAIQLYYLKPLARLGVFTSLKRDALSGDPVRSAVCGHVCAQIIGQIFLEFNIGDFHLKLFVSPNFLVMLSKDLRNLGFGLLKFECVTV